ncbi:MAG: FKBP-type peptidyl-prolyl cis-trans isomerase, partial [Clostridia bacterium]|nr:FKBP-type peptidyl-prolyl cis-trans isomerase [Clostridia bacterium]
MKIKAKIAAFLLAATTLASTLIGCSAYNNPEKYLNIPDFKEVSVAKEDIDEELKKQINDILESLRKADYVEVEDKDYQIKLGDSVNITYEGKPTDTDLELIDDVLKGMTNKDDEAGYDLVIGSDSFIGEYKDKDGNLVNEGFEEQLKGHKKGDEVDVIVTFPDDYKEKELQGVEVNFKVKINSISTLEGIDLGNDAQEVKVSYT